MFSRLLGVCFVLYNCNVSSNEKVSSSSTKLSLVTLLETSSCSSKVCLGQELCFYCNILAPAHIWKSEHFEDVVINFQSPPSNVFSHYNLTVEVNNTTPLETILRMKARETHNNTVFQCLNRGVNKMKNFTAIVGMVMNCAWLVAPVAFLCKQLYT